MPSSQSVHKLYTIGVKHQTDKVLKLLFNGKKIPGASVEDCGKTEPKEMWTAKTKQRMKLI